MWWWLTQCKRRWFQVSLIHQQVQLWNLIPLLKSTNIKGFMRGTTHLGMIWIVSSRNVLVFSTINNWEVIYSCLFAINFKTTC
jgi:hypothetical protein